MNVTEKPELHQDWIDPHAYGIVKALQKSGYMTYLVGGCVRDLLLNIAPKDFDIATSAVPDDVRKIIYRSYVIGKRFRLVLVKREGQQFEVSTFRRELRADEIQDEGLSPDNIFGTCEEDARRRDFTINGLFYDPVANKLIDYADGLPDLEARVIRMIGDPNKRLLEDPIRILRGLRLKHMIGFTLTPDLREAMQVHASCLEKAVLPRIREELLKWLRLPDPSAPFLEAYDLGILHALSPTLAKALDEQNGVEEFVAQLRTIHDADVDKTNAVDLFGILVHAFVRAFIIPDPATVLKNKELIEHPILNPWMRDELGMFKFEQALVLKSFHLQPLLAKRKEFQKRGERRQAALIRNPAFPLALKWCERDYSLSTSDFHFWSTHFEEMLKLNLPARNEPRRRRRTRRPRRDRNAPRAADSAPAEANGNTQED
jgi:poly(A) polymerase